MYTVVTMVLQCNCCVVCFLQCFDAVGWAAGRDPARKKIWGMVDVGTG